MKRGNFVVWELGYLWLSFTGHLSCYCIGAMCAFNWPSTVFHKEANFTLE